MVSTRHNRGEYEEDASEVSSLPWGAQEEGAGLSLGGRNTVDLCKARQVLAESARPA